MKEKKLAHDLGIEVEEAVGLINAYLETYPAVRNFFNEAVEEARLCGYAWTMLGRRRFLQNILSNNDWDRFADERKACNTPIQGSAADFVKVAMLQLDAANLDQDYDCHMVSQVHDELLFECNPDSVEEVRPIIRDLMEHPLPTDLAVPLTISMGTGNNWHDTH